MDKGLTMRFCGFVVFLSAVVECTGQPDGKHELRLSDEVVPVFESIQLTLDADSSGFSGSVHVQLEVRKQTDSFRFHAEGLVLRLIILRQGTMVVPVSCSIGETGLVNATTDVMLHPGEYTLEVVFTALFNTQSVSLYRVEKGGDTYIFSQFQAWHARKAFPCWDEPSFKIPYRFTITVPQRHAVVTNTPMESEHITDGRRTVSFERTPPLPSYLLAVAAGPLEMAPVAGTSIPCRVVTTRGGTQRAGEAARYAPPILKALESYFGSPYPFRKLDLIGVPENAMFGAMENAGAVTFLESILLLDSATASAAQRRMLVSLTAHELAHMWFGDLVTMEWWDDIWLNESFASWLGDKIAGTLFPEFRIAVGQVSGANYAMRSDAHLSSRAIRQAVTPRDNPSLSFDEISYDKGQAVIGMIEHWMGDREFRNGVLDYISSHQGGNATADDLWNSLSKYADEDVPGSMASFLEQPGVPLVTAELLPGGRVRLSQRRFLNHGVHDPEARCWLIPIVMRYPTEHGLDTLKVLLKQPSEIFPLRIAGKPGWLHPNAGERGYYRWVTGPGVIDSMVQRSGEILDTRESVGLVDHLSALVDAGLLSGSKFVESVSSFAGDERPEVIGAVLGAVGKAGEDFVAESPGLEDLFARYLRTVFGPVLNRFGRGRINGEAEAVSLLRPRLVRLLGVEGRDSGLRSYGDSLARVYLESPASVDPALADAVLYIAATRGSSDLFRKYQERFETTELAMERERYLSVLGYFQDSFIVERALEYVRTGPLKPTEVLRIPTAISIASPQHRDRVFEWIMTNYDFIVARIGVELAAYLPWYTLGASEQRLNTGRRFFAGSSHTPAGTAQELEKVAEEVMRRVRLREREGNSVKDYLLESRESRKMNPDGN
jgi:alanyl aminopeptidase